MQILSLPRPTQTPFALSGVAVLLLCAAWLAGPAYNSYLHYDFSHSPDSKSYTQIAQGNFDVSVTHRYRVVVPFLAKAVSLPIETIFGIIWPHRDNAGHHLRFGFFVVNLALMSLVGWALLRTCQAYGLSLMASVLAVGALLASRWANYLASLPLVDSFHMLCVALVFLAIKTQNSRLLAVAILLGPISKESFVFLVPATLLFGSLRVSVQLFLYVCSGLIVVATHALIDWYSPSTDVGSVQGAFQHLHNIGFSVRRGLSPGGMGEVFTVLGVFNLVWMWALLQPNRRQLWQPIDVPLWFLLAVAIFQALISTSLARMLFVAGPLWVVLLGQGFQLIYDKMTSQCGEAGAAPPLRQAG